MKILLQDIQRAFDATLKQLDMQVWDRINPYVACKRMPFADISTDEIVSNINLDDDVPEDKVKEAVTSMDQQLTRVANHIAQLPAIYMMRLLKHGVGTEINTPAGCNPFDPDEIRSAVKRAARILGDNDLVIICAPSTEQFFFEALEETTPPSICGRKVKFAPSTEILDERVVMELFPEPPAGQEQTALKPEDAAARLLEAAQRSPYYILPDCKRDNQKPFVYHVKDRAHVIGPKLAVQWQTELQMRPDIGDAVVRVSPSKIVLANSMPKVLK